MEDNKNTNVNEGLENETNNSKTYTQEEVDALLQKEGAKH